MNGTFSYMIFLFGLGLLILPALIGKGSFVKFLFGGGIWTFFGNASYGIFMMNPIMCVTVFLST